jgi:hypothetical protein
MIAGILAFACAPASSSSSSKSSSGAPSNVNYSTNPAKYPVNAAVSTNSLSYSGQTATSIAISPSTLPVGLSFDSSTGNITGTPTQITAEAIYRVTIVNQFGSNFVDLDLAVTDVPPTISLSGSTSFTYAVGTAIADIAPTLGGGTTTSCGSSPALPAGLSLSDQCVVSGTPTAPAASGTYKINASNTGGSASLSLTIQVNAVAPSISYSGSPQTFIRNQATAGWAPANSGGTVESCSSNPPLPTGLSLSNTCAISGTPTVISSAANYAITATNTGGTSTATVSIAVQDELPAISYPSSPYTFTVNHAISAVNVTNSGGTITGCSVSPALPSGLTLSQGCQVSGTPTAVTASGSYTVTASNTAGNATATLSLRVVDNAPTLTYSGGPYAFTSGTTISTITPTDTGGAIVSCASLPTLPSGLNLSTGCLISGNPTATSAATSYTITATNTGGSASATVSIAVSPAAPAFSYSGSPFSFNKNVTIPTTSPTYTGGVPTSCSSNPVLPSGLALSNSCVISGTPTAISAATSYTITGTNSTGSGSATLSITVNDTPPQLNYAGNPFTFAANASVGTINPSNSGGVVNSCSSSPTLPAGLSLSNGCVITGTPTATSTLTSYTITSTNTGGSTTTTISITVNASAPSISYPTGPFTFTKGMAISTVTPTNSGGAITSCTSNPTLPTGLSLSTGCVITGMPTAVTAEAGYAITATNASGNSSTSTVITVNDQAPVISYSPSTYTFTNGTAITTFSPTHTGGAIVSCTASPALPAGLSIAATTCAVSGTPTALAAAANYVVTATNSGGSSTFTLNLTVNATPPTLSYAGSPYTYTKGTAITTLTPSAGGGAITSCTSNPPLPSGLSLDNTSCAISGTPTSVVAATSYTITATNSGGSATATINVQVNDVAPSISYTGSPYSNPVGSAITAIMPVNSGGAIVSCGITPTLPAGLSYSSTTCAITGAPTAITAAANYTIAATNTGGTSSATISIAITAAAPVISYPGSPYTYTVGTSISALNPSNSGGAIASCSITPTLPVGLSYSSTSCAISGNPTASTAAASYTVLATNAGGSSSTTVTFSVNNAAPNINYLPTSYSFIYTKGTAISNLTPNNTGGPITSCTISASLPAGLSFSSTTCTISGTPAAIFPATSYNIVATNNGGSSTATITITVNDAPPVIAYAGSPYTYSNGTAITTLTPTNTGGAPTSCAVSPNLPAGLGLANSTCAVSGTPTAVAAQATYTITATNTGGSASTSIVITVNDVAPTLSYTGGPYTFTSGTTITAVTPTTGGGTITSCTSSPNLPIGLSLNNTTCVLSGTPTATAAAANYTITATNSGGSATSTVNITVNAVAPTLSYAGSPYVYSKGVAVSTLTPTNNGGAITGCSSSPPLPAGLNLSSACVISGTPTTITAAANYTITASNSGGSANATINITINDVAPSIGYSPNTLTYVVRYAISTATPSNSGGTITGCSSSPALPAGLSISNTTCNITGTPTTPTPATTYTITATNTGGSGTATLNMTINDQMQILFYGTTALAGTWNGTAAASQNIWRASLDKTVIASVTANSTAGLGSENPVANPAGTGISYASLQKEGATSSSSYNIFTSTPSGGSLTYLTTNTAAGRDSSNDTFASNTIGEAPVFSPDGTKIAFASKQPVNGTTSSSHNIWVMEVNGNNMVALTQNTTTGLDSTNPVWDPTSTSIYFTSLQSTSTTTSSWNSAASSSSNIWKVNATGTTLTDLTADNTSGINCYGPVISPDGSTLTYYSTEKLGSVTPSSYNIWQRAASNGASATPLTENSTAGLDSKYPTYSSDGTMIAFSSKMQVSGTTPLSYNIWTMSSSGSNQVALTANTATALDSYEPSFSPDSNWLAFFSHMKIGSTTASSYNIWIVGATGSGLTNVTANTSSGLDSYLAPGGRGVWYQPPP